MGSTDFCAELPIIDDTNDKHKVLFCGRTETPQPIKKHLFLTRKIYEQIYEKNNPFFVIPYSIRLLSFPGILCCDTE